MVPRQLTWFRFRERRGRNCTGNFGLTVYVRLVCQLNLAAGRKLPLWYFRTPASSKAIILNLLSHVAHENEAFVSNSAKQTFFFS